MKNYSLLIQIDEKEPVDLKEMISVSHFKQVELEEEKFHNID